MCVCVCVCVCVCACACVCGSNEAPPTSEGPRLLAEDLEPSVVPMMLTNIDGARSYAAGLRFSRPFFIQKVSLVASNLTSTLLGVSGRAASTI